MNNVLFQSSINILKLLNCGKVRGINEVDNRLLPINATELPINSRRRTHNDRHQ